MAADRSPERPAILIADDDAGMRRMLEIMLTREGYEVVQAHDGEAALALARSRPLRLIVIDLNMPTMDGGAFCRTYREHGGQAPIVLVTGARIDHEMVDQYGADGYLTKPFRLNDILAIVERLTGPGGA